MKEQQISVAQDSTQAAAVALTQLIVQAEANGPDGAGWDRMAVLRAYRHCFHFINRVSAQSVQGAV